MRHSVGASPLRGWVLQVRAAVQQTRRDAPARIVRLLGEALGGERARVRRLARLDQSGQRMVEHGDRARVVGHAAGGRAVHRRQGTAEVHAVGKRHEQAREQHHGRRQRGRVGEHLAPARGQVRRAAHVHDVEHGGDDEQPDGGIGPEQDELHASRTRGSTHVYAMSTRM
jgi:hypothetical protein